MSVVQLYELEDYMGRQLEGSEIAGASPIVGYVQHELEAWLGRTLERATYSETGLPVYPGQNFLELTYTPIHSVTTLTIDGQNWTPGSWALERSGVWLYSMASVVTGLTATEVSSADVTYVGGLGDPGLSACKPILIRRCARLIEKRHSDESGLQNINVEGYNASWISEDFTDAETAVLKRYKRRVVSAPSWPSDLDADPELSWKTY